MIRQSTPTLIGRGAIALAIAVGSTVTLSSAATATRLRVTTRNMSPNGSFVLSNPWAGFHDGDFDLYNLGEPVPEDLMTLVEHGVTTDIANTFINNGAGVIQGTILEPPTIPDEPAVLLPGETATQIFEIDDGATENLFFSYATAVAEPTNNWFLANQNPKAVQIFDDTGKFLRADFTVSLAQVQDAGLNNGEDVITTVFPNANPTVPDNQILRFTIEEVETTAVPEPSIIGMLLLAGLFPLLNRAGILSSNHRQR